MSSDLERAIKAAYENLSTRPACFKAGICTGLPCACAEGSAKAAIAALNPPSDAVLKAVHDAIAAECKARHGLAMYDDITDAAISAYLAAILKG